jgi:hypothetical protein
MLAFLQVMKTFLTVFIGKFNKACSRFICTVEQIDVFLVCIFLSAVLVIVSISPFMKSPRCKIIGQEFVVVVVVG